MSLISINGETALLELTSRCYTGCPYCYKKGTIHSRGNHVSLKTLLERLDWIYRFTNAQNITLLGGEPLLNPDFIQICQHIISAGKDIDIITSGVVSKPEENNLQYMIDLYREGRIFVQLSYHGSHNHKQFVKIHKLLSETYLQRRQALTALGKYVPEHFDFSTTAVIPKK